MAEISKITLPSGSSYDIKDAYARGLIAELNNATTSGIRYLGVTTTPLEDGSETNMIKIGDQTVSVLPGDITAYGDDEFIWSYVENQWRKFGSTGTLKALAFKDNASGTYTPQGSVSQPTFNGTKVNILTKVVPTGTVSTPTITVTPSSTSVYSITDVGTVPSCTLPSLTTTVQDEVLTISWAEGSFSEGSVPTRASVSVVDGITSATSSQPTFSGEEGTYYSDDYTPSGSVTKPTFTGTSDTVTVS